MNKHYISPDLRERVKARANDQCEYCLIPQYFSFLTHPIDHVIAQKHGGKTDIENLALSCSLCNKYKGSDISSIDSNTQSITPLFHPRTQQWPDHFKLTDTGLIMPLTPEGRVTAFLLKFNQPIRIKRRHLLILEGIL